MAIHALSTLEPAVIRNCERCAVPYDWRRSTSRSLRMTYCSSLCETADLGSTIEGMLAVSRAEVSVVVPSPADFSSASPVATAGRWLAPGCPVCGGDTYLQEDGSDACIQCGARLITAEHFPRR